MPILIKACNYIRRIYIYIYIYVVLYIGGVTFSEKKKEMEINIFIILNYTQPKPFCRGLVNNINAD